MPIQSATRPPGTSRTQKKTSNVGTPMAQRTGTTSSRYVPETVWKKTDLPACYRERKSAQCGNLQRQDFETIRENRSASLQKNNNNPADPLCCRLDLFVMDVCVAQCHRNLTMTKKLRNRREREALHDGVGGEGVAKIV